MESNSQQLLRLRTLTSRLCDGELTGEESAELTTLLDGNSAATAEYLAYTSLHLDLGQRLRSYRDSTAPSQNGARHVTSDTEKRLYAPPRPRASSRKFRWTAHAAIAASLLVAAAFLMRTANSSPNYTALVVKTIDCDWGQRPPETSKPTPLTAGTQIRFSHGLMVVKFASGAEVKLEAPIDFAIVDVNRGQLNAGKLTATVPAPAHGFAVRLPAFEVVDLGTRFGAKVSDDGNCEAHVFQGQVRVRTIAADQQIRELKLSAGAAVAMAKVGGEFRKITAAPELFEKEPRVLSRLLPDAE